eukprot:NODE_3519_length_952_cov_67.792727_g3367_i0.p1 GENE.NODE_3519_length_952_cov_67.792727_g3367_i0~~NODE_3519_length_952_cov_67.792727_g3367_i0.p1  ORF type:complete len:286 (+),score=95.65 NODE_3519_length_952_cov_67.792727_g3367_i0:68-859(+)
MAHQPGWRGQLVGFWHGHTVHNGLLLLLLLDVLIVVAELLMDSHKECHVTTVECGMDPIDTSHGPRIDNQVCAGGSVRIEQKAELPHWLHDTHEWCHVISFNILVIFEVEILSLLLGLGLAALSDKLLLLDFVVVTVSLLADLCYHGHEGDLLIVLRMWRFGRVFHGVAMAVHEAESKAAVGDKERLLQEKKSLEAKLEQMEKRLTTLQEADAKQDASMDRIEKLLVEDRQDRQKAFVDLSQQVARLAKTTPTFTRSLSQKAR